MEYQLDRQIHLSQESEHRSLYAWSLKELDKEGKELVEKQVPWSGYLYFLADELEYRFEIGDDAIAIGANAKESEWISASLNPCEKEGGEWVDGPSYSMFGTDRVIKKFLLYIQPTDEDHPEEQCWLWGSPLWYREHDFNIVVEDDVVGVTIYLTKDKFTRLADQIKRQRVGDLEFRVGFVSGFYSRWSPSIYTDSIKVLTKDLDAPYEDDEDHVDWGQQIIFPDDCEFNPPRLEDKKSDFAIRVFQRNVSHVKSDLTLLSDGEVSEINDSSGEWNNEDQPPKFEAEATSELLEQLSRNEEVLSKLKTPIWLIFVVLVLLLLVLIW